MSTLNLTIRKGMYCSWCFEMMQSTLKHQFDIQALSVDKGRKNVHITSKHKLNPGAIISYLKKRGYTLKRT